MRMTETAWDDDEWEAFLKAESKALDEFDRRYSAEMDCYENEMEGRY